MIPGQAVHAPPAAPAGPSPLAAMLKQRAGAAPQMHQRGPAPQAAGAPMPLNAGGHAAARFGHAPAVVPGC